MHSNLSECVRRVPRKPLKTSSSGFLYVLSERNPETPAYYKPATNYSDDPFQRTAARLRRPR